MVKKAAPPATKAKTKAPVEDKVDRRPKLDVRAMYNTTLNVIAKRQGFECSSLDVCPPMSTALLALDLVLGGGIRPCMMTGAGEEQCAKTTVALNVMGAAIVADIPIIAFVDFEGSTKNSKPYVHNILKGMGIKMTMDQVFGKQDPKTGQYIIPPRVRYRSEVILERFYDWLAEVLRDLPDKRYVEGKWWLIFDAEDKKKKAEIEEFIDPVMTRKYGNGWWVPAPDDKLQGIIFVDSYTAMNPEAKDKEEISNQLSVKASAFSKQLERVKGRMVQKMVTVYGLNHLRSNPMAMFGPKDSEKGGKALQQFSDVRMRQVSRSLSAAPFSPKKGKKTFDEQEPSVEFDGLDTYRYVHLKANKNKLWTPQRECLIRLWTEDADGQARGIDPVFDTIYYLKQTGQLSGTRAGFKLNLDGLGASKKPIPWGYFKKWVLGDKDAMTKISTVLGYKPMSIRKFCFSQMAKGIGELLYVSTQKAKAGKGETDDVPSDDDDGDDE